MFSKLDYEFDIKLRRELALELLNRSQEEYQKIFDTLKNELPIESNSDFWIKTLKDLQNYYLKDSGWEIEELFN